MYKIYRLRSLAHLQYTYDDSILNYSEQKKMIQMRFSLSECTKINVNRALH